MEVTTIAMLIALGTLVAERSFSLFRKIKKSKCWQVEIDFKDCDEEK